MNEGREGGRRREEEERRKRRRRSGTAGGRIYWGETVGDDAVLDNSGCLIYYLLFIIGMIGLRVHYYLLHYTWLHLISFCCIVWYRLWYILHPMTSTMIDTLAATCQWFRGHECLQEYADTRLESQLPAFNWLHAAVVPIAARRSPAEKRNNISPHQLRLQPPVK